MKSARSGAQSSVLAQLSGCNMSKGLTGHVTCSNCYPAEAECDVRDDFSSDACRLCMPDPWRNGRQRRQHCQQRVEVGHLRIGTACSSSGSL